MSLNLTLKVDGTIVDLIQTPTDVTFEILGTEDKVQGNKQDLTLWDEVAQRYLDWVDREGQKWGWEEMNILEREREYLSRIRTNIQSGKVRLSVWDWI